jgi:hypothetical protein
MRQTLGETGTNGLQEFPFGFRLYSLLHSEKFQDCNQKKTGMLSYTIYPLGLTSRHAQKHLIYKERIF